MPIRRLIPTDAAAYRAVMLQAYADPAQAFTATVEEREGLPLAWWEARISAAADAPQRVLGAFVEDRLAGVAGLLLEQRPRTRHKAQLYGMFVLPEFRGQGLGRALVLAVLDAAREMPGIQVVRLTVLEPNHSARRLYEACGFRPFGTEPFANRFDESYVAIVHMWCPVGPEVGGDVESRGE